MHNGAARPKSVAPPATTIESWSDALARQTEEHPFRSVAVALGAGYVLGGGLFSPLTARVAGAAVRIGLRLAIVPFVTQSLVAAGETILAEDDPRHPTSKET
jgi:hypothetical protein